MKNGCRQSHRKDFSSNYSQTGYGERLAAMGLGRAIDRRKKTENGESKSVGAEAIASHGSSDSSSPSKIEEDDDVVAERNAMISGSFPQDAPIQVYGLRKEFGGGKFIAVDNVSFHVPNGQCFGMLGPNGAGKTTTISMLTGLIPTTKGEAIVAGKDLFHDITGVYSRIGVCPQFDVCWPELTIEQHLRFYARLKGVSRDEENQAITSLIEAIGLTEAHAAKRNSKALSGGMRRRLSLAIALIGQPPVVFLDEPTTGLDPETKRNIWSLIDTFKKDRCIVLTTHSMDEADALCSRIGIMSHGKLRCLGENLHLKNVYGNGYKIEVRFMVGMKSAAAAFMEGMLPEARKQESAHTDVLVYGISKGNAFLSDVMRRLDKRPMSAGIIDYGIRQTSLEEVFLKIARESEAAFQAKDLEKQTSRRCC